MSFLNTSFFKNLSMAFIANLVSLIGSTVLTLILPKFIGVTQYSYYQLYIFYASYIGFLGLGWLDGIYLRYGGKFYDKIDKKLFSAQFRTYSVFESILSIIIFILTLLNFPGYEKEFVYACCCMCIVIYMPRAILHQLLQTTGRVKEYAKCLIIEKLMHIVITLSGILLGRGDFEWFIISEIIGRFFATIYIFNVCHDIVKTKPYPIKKVASEIKVNIYCGFVLMISNIASMFVIGVIRQAIVMCWDVETFGRISLTLSISSLLLIFINSIAMVLFPMLKRVDRYELENLYTKIRSLLMIVVFSSLLLYLPVRKIFSLWLPEYAESFKYMAILFPMIVFESKMALLINTYLKALRLERKLLFINLTSVGISIMLAYISCTILHSLDYAVMSIIVALIIRCILAEIILKNYINIQICKNILFEIMLTTIFIFGSWCISGLFGFVLYLIFYIVFIIFNFKQIMQFLKISKKYCNENR